MVSVWWLVWVFLAGGYAGFLLLALLRVGGDRGWTRLHKTTVGGIALLVLVAAGGLLTWAGRVSARNRQREGAMF